MSEEYVKVKAILVIRKMNAALFEFELEHGKPDRQHWIPVSLIHGGDVLKKIKNENATELVEFRLMEWKARELQL